VATLVQADWLFLLTDVPNLFTANPNTDPSAEAIYEVPDLSKLHVSGRRVALWAHSCMPVSACLALVARLACVPAVPLHGQ
jgi:glutamate 5-kinase